MLARKVACSLSPGGLRSCQRAGRISPTLTTLHSTKDHVTSFRVTARCRSSVVGVRGTALGGDVLRSRFLPDCASERGTAVPFRSLSPITRSPFTRRPHQRQAGACRRVPSASGPADATAAATSRTPAACESEPRALSRDAVHDAGHRHRCPSERSTSGHRNETPLRHRDADDDDDPRTLRGDGGNKTGAALDLGTCGTRLCTEARGLGVAIAKVHSRSAAAPLQLPGRPR